MQTLLSKAQITQRVKELAKEISQDHKQSGNSLPPVMICILNGAIHFFSDLTRSMDCDCEVDFVRVKSYEGQDNSGGVVWTKHLETELKGKRVYIVDDICDTGQTIMEVLYEVNGKLPAEVRVVTLLRRGGMPDLTDFCGFVIDNEWVFGYGMDDNKLRRNREDVHVLTVMQQ